MKKQVRIVAFLLVLVLAAAGGAYAATRPLAVETVAIYPETVALTFTEPGSYEYSRVFSVYPLVAGEILEIAVEEGDRVGAGDTIAVVSASDYGYQIQQLYSTIAGYNGQIADLRLREEQERSGLSATLQGLEGELVVLEAEMAKNQSNNESLESQISMQERIVDNNLNQLQHARKYLREMRDYGDDHEVFQARQALNAAQNAHAQSLLLLEQLREGDIPQGIYEGQRQAIQGQIAVVQRQMGESYTGGLHQYYSAQIAAAQTSIAQMEERSGQATITAPVSGVVARLPAKDQNLLSQQSVAAIIGGDPLVEVFVPIREIDGVSPGDRVELILDKRLDKEIIGGTVVEIEGEAQVRLSALGVEERKVRVLVRPERNILQIGYDMDVRFSPYTFPEALVVPKTAVFQVDGGDHVWVVRDGLLVLCGVQAGTETREGYILDGGLMPGEVVVLDADNDGLAEGRRVSVPE